MGCKRDLCRAKLDEPCDFMMRESLKIARRRMSGGIAKMMEK